MMNIPSLKDIFGHTRNDKKALVIEGGGMRGIYIQGVLQSFHDRNYFPWKLIAGSSAGALSAVPYALGQIHISRDAFFSYLLSSKFINMSNLLRPTKHILNLDWMIDSIMFGEESIDVTRIKKAPPVIITATSIKRKSSPETVYFNSCQDEIKTVLKATAALPFLYRGFVNYKDMNLLDGGILDPVPLKAAHDAGFRDDEIVVILTRPKGYRKKQESFWEKTLMELYYRDPDYRGLVQTLESRYINYNKILDQIEFNHPDLTIIYPQDNFKMERLTRDAGSILSGFTSGINAGKNFLHSIGYLKSRMVKRQQEGLLSE